MFGNLIPTSRGWRREIKMEANGLAGKRMGKVRAPRGLRRGESRRHSLRNVKSNMNATLKNAEWLDYLHAISKLSFAAAIVKEACKFHP